MARVHQLDAQHATHRAQKRIKPGRHVGAQVTDHHIFNASNDEFRIDADLRWEASTKVTDVAASNHPCELDRDNDTCTHPDHDRDAEWAKEALDWLGLPGEDLLPADEPVPFEDYVPPFDVEQAQQNARLTRSAFTRPDWGWQDDAACHGESLVLFFGPDGERAAERRTREKKAQRICVGCPVRTQCLDYAVSRPEKYGTYGGLNEDERASERRRRQRRANAA